MRFEFFRGFCSAVSCLLQRLQLLQSLQKTEGGAVGDQNNEI
jgi:hypothetical protein